MASNSSKRTSDPLAMQIYAAVLGGAPKVSKAPPQPQSRLKFEVRLETITSGLESPFHSPGIKETLERAAAGAINALSEASERLRRARPTKKPEALITAASAETSATPKGPTPIVLIGPGAIRVSEKIQHARERSARSSRDAGRSAAA